MQKGDRTKSDARNIPQSLTKLPSAPPPRTPLLNPYKADNTSAATKKKLAVDFSYWVKVPFWTPEEAAALLLESEPPKFVDPLERIYSREFRHLRLLFSRAKDTGLITDQSPASWVDAAKGWDVPCPDKLQKLLPKKVKFSTKTRNVELQKAANQLALDWREKGQMEISKREVAKALSCSVEWKELTAGRIERLIRSEW